MAAMTGQGRRSAGVVLLIVALAAIVIVPTINGRRVAGTAVPIVFPPPPQLGDCALPPFPDDAATGGFPVEIPVTELHFGSCDGTLVGEVVALEDLSDHRSSAPSTEPSESSNGPCFGATASYAGLTVSARSATLPNAPTGGPARWMPTIGATTFLVVPGVAERTAGHNWTACLAVPTGNLAYHGTLRNAYAAGKLPDQFGLCWAGTDLDEMPALIRCDEAHTAELLATGWIENRALISRPDVDAACLDIAGRVMRTEDPTRQGAITIVLDPVHRDGASDPAAPLAVNCFATAAASGRQLTHTVIGLAGGAVPLAG